MAFFAGPKKKKKKKAYSPVINGRKSFLNQKKKKKQTVESHSAYDPTIKLNLLFFCEIYGNGNILFQTLISFFMSKH